MSTSAKATLGFVGFLLIISLVINGFFIFDKYLQKDNGTGSGTNNNGIFGGGTSSGGNNNGLEEISLELGLNNLLISELYDFVTYENEKRYVENSIYTNSKVTVSNLSDRDKLARVYDKTGEYFSMSCEFYNLINYKFTTNSISNMVLSNAFYCDPEIPDKDEFLKYQKSYAKDGYPVAYKATFEQLETQVSKWFGKTTSVSVIDFSPDYNTSCVVDLKNLYCLDIKTNFYINTRDQFIKALKYTDRIEIYNKYAYYADKGTVYNNVLKGEKIGSDYTPSQNNLFEKYPNIKTYKHTFKMNNDGSYYWYSTEPV